MRMHNSPHPGGVLLRQWIEPLGISITQAAKHLGVSLRPQRRVPGRRLLRLAAFRFLQGEGCVFTKR